MYQAPITITGASWANVDGTPGCDGIKWAVRVHGNIGKATGHSGELAEVTTRAGATKVVKLGRQLTQWNGGRTALYEARSAR